jgi:hypothetical protein
VIAAEPLDIRPDVDIDDLDATTRRVGWRELLDRADTLSWECVRQVLAWDGGRHFAFAHSVRVDLTTLAGREWADRLEPVERRTAGYACMDGGDKGRAMVDPLTDAPVSVLDDEAVTAVPQRLPATSELSAVILEKTDLDPHRRRQPLSRAHGSLLRAELGLWGRRPGRSRPADPPPAR